MICNHTCRIYLAVVRPVHTMPNVPAWFYVESYAERLCIYFLLLVSVVASFVWLCRRKLSLGIKVALGLAWAPPAIVYTCLLISGAGTLYSSAYWKGGQIIHGAIYTGYIPRTLAARFEPYLTIAFLLGLAALAYRLWLAGFARPGTVLLVLLFVVVLLQVLPRVPRGTLTEAISAADFHYTFHHDRSIAFPSLPVEILLLAISSSVCRRRGCNW